MNLQFERRLGGGAFGDVWLARDELGRLVAAKLISASAAAISSALDHARALARVRHGNIVGIYTITRANHPESQAEYDCVVMEYIDGPTLRQHLASGPLTLDSARHLGLGLIDGVEAIHSAGLVHGDLHAENVIVENGSARIIDILYRGSLSDASTDDRERRVGEDLTSLRILLSELLHNTQVDPGEAAQFNHLLTADATVASIRTAWIHISDHDRASSVDRLITHAIRRLLDPQFVDGNTYADALAQETPSHITLPLALRLIDERKITWRHVPYLRIILGRLTSADRASILNHLSQRLDAETPSGEWYPLLMILKAFGESGWRGLNATTALRLEAVMVNDVLGGHINIHGFPRIGGGHLGTHVSTFWRLFKDQQKLVDNIASMLRQNWYTQNYVGEFLITMLPRLATTSERRDKLVKGLADAVKNDARVVKNKLSVLPEDWQEDIATLAAVSNR